METDSICIIRYLIEYVIAQLTSWMTYLQGEYADYALEVKVAIWIIIGSVAGMLMAVTMIYLRRRIDRKNRKCRKEIEARYGQLIKDIVTVDDAENISFETMAQMFHVVAKEEAPNGKRKKGLQKEITKSDIEQELRGKDQRDGIMPTSGTHDARVVEAYEAQLADRVEKKYHEALVKSASAELKTARYQMQFCQLVCDTLIHDEDKLCNVKNLHTMLELFDMKAFLESQVDHGNMERKVKCVNMMNILRLDINLWLVNTMLMSKNPHIHRQAMYAAITSGVNDGMDYFTSEFFDQNSCMRDEIELGYALQRRRANGMSLPNLAHVALMHKHPATQRIFVRVMRSFGQSEYCSQLESLFKSCREARLMAEIATTWGVLGYQQGEPLMIEALPLQPDGVKITFLHAFALLNTGRVTKLFREYFVKSLNPEVRLEALRCLYFVMGSDSREIEQLRQDVCDEDKSFFRFFDTGFGRNSIDMTAHEAYAPIEQKSTIYHWAGKDKQYHQKGY